MLLIWAFCFYAIRIWVKTGLKRLDSWDYDDTLVSLSFVCSSFRCCVHSDNACQLSALLHVVTVCISINHGFGNRWATISTTDISTIQKSLYASQILYIASLGLTRLSSAFFVTRLSRHEQHKLIARGWLVLCVIWTIASILVISFRGNLAHPWSTVDGSAPMVGGNWRRKGHLLMQIVSTLDGHRNLWRCHRRPFLGHFGLPRLGPSYACDETYYGSLDICHEADVSATE